MQLSFPDPVIAAIYDYWGTGYKSLNSQLRDTANLYAAEQELHDRLLEAVTPMTGDLVVYRGACVPNSYLERTYWVEPAWTSTTPLCDIAAGFKSHNFDLHEDTISTLWEIHLPKSLPVLMLGDIVQTINPRCGFAKEIVLAPETHFEREDIICADGHHRLVLHASSR